MYGQQKRMRSLLVLFCITGFLAKDIARLSWEIWFKINQVEIIAEKCENKDKPMMHCDGNCYLSKQLKKLELKEQEHNEKRNPFQDQFKFELSVAPSAVEIPSLAPKSQEMAFFLYNFRLKLGIYTSFFHPPTTAIEV